MADTNFAQPAILTEQSSAATPPANTVALYPKTDGRFYGKDDAGTEFAIGTIGGTTGTVDNVIARADGTGGYTVQGSNIVIADATTSTQRNVQIYNNQPAATSFAITATAATDVITATGHTFVASDCIVFTALAGGSGLQLEPIPYFVRDVVAGTSFKVAITAGGAAVDITADYTSGNVESANSALVLTPKGTGAFILGPKPDGTTTGGNARGTNAVDLQLERSAATQVASGTNSFVVGRRNTASGNFSFAAGNSNTASNNGAIALGQSCTASGGNSLSATDQSSASGTGAIVLAYRSTASATFSGVFAGGDALANRYGMQAHSSGSFSGTAGSGDAQRARFVLRCKTTTNAAVEMALDGGTTYLGIPSGKVIACTINISGVKSDGSAVAHYVRQYAVKNVGGTSSEVYAPVTIGTDNAAGTTIALSANNTDDTLRIAVTGIAAETWRWVASVDAVEIAYGT